MTLPHGEALPALARAAIALRLGIAADWPPADPGWQQPAASFVTLTKHHQLRGCIGSLQAWRPLIDDIRANAEAAAFHDPRFAAVEAGELPEIQLEVSVLSAPQPLPTMDHAELITTLRPNIDGLIVHDSSGARANFRPQVWQQLPDVELFLQQLKLKAGLPTNCDDSTLRYATYQVEKFSDNP